MRQNMVEIIVWENILHETKNLARIVELGYLHGGLSLYFWLQAARMRIKFITFDIKPNPYIFKTGLQTVIPKRVFVQGDIFSDHLELVKKNIQAKGKTLLVCDDGDKPREFELFGGFLKSGDIIAVHDFDKEISFEDIHKGNYHLRYEMIFTDLTIDCGSAWRLFKV